MAREGPFSSVAQVLCIVILSVLLFEVSGLSKTGRGLLPRSPSRSFNRKSLDDLLKAELDDLDRKLERDYDFSRRDSANEKASRKRTGFDEREALDPRYAPETVSRLEEEIEFARAKEDLLEKKLVELENRLEEESLSKALLLARVPLMFEGQRSGSTLMELVSDEKPLMSKSDREEYCHFVSLKHCGFKTLEELRIINAIPKATHGSTYASNTSANDIPIWERCIIKDKFLDCMIKRKHETCHPGSSATLSKKSLQEFRKVLMKSLQSAKGCWLPK